MNLLDMAKARQQAEEQGEMDSNHACLIYGAAKTGKTRLAATTAMAKSIDRVFWFDNENGYDTLFTMMKEGLLSEEAAAKIIIIPVKDTRAEPYAIETMLKVLNSIKNPVYIDLHTGRCLKAKPAKVGEEHGVLEFQYSKLTSRDCIVTDSLSQLGDSALNGTCAGEDYTFKPLLDNYGLAGKWLNDCLSIMQQATYCNFVAVTHEVMLEGEDKRERLFPLCGTTKFSPKVGKYFGTCIYTEKQGIKHKVGSGSTYGANKITGSRRGLLLEKAKGEPSLVSLFDVVEEEAEVVNKPTKTTGALNRLIQK